MKGLLFSGDIRIAYVDADGVPTGQFIGVLNTPKLSINVPDPDTKTRQSKQNDSFGQALDTIFLPKPTEIDITIDDLGEQEVLGWAVNGETTGYTQTGAAIVDEVITAAKGKWSRLANRAISAVTVTNSAGTITYANGTDYAIGGDAGFIKVLTGGAITEAQSLKVDYTAAALTGTRINVGTRSSLSLQIEGDMRNLTDGGKYHVKIPLARVSPSGGLDLMGNDFLVAGLKGTLVSVNGNPVSTIDAIA